MSSFEIVSPPCASRRYPMRRIAMPGHTRAVAIICAASLTQWVSTGRRPGESSSMWFPFHRIRAASPWGRYAGSREPAHSGSGDPTNELTHGALPLEYALGCFHERRVEKSFGKLGEVGLQLSTRTESSSSSGTSLPPNSRSLPRIIGYSTSSLHVISTSVARRNLIPSCHGASARRRASL